MSGCVNNCTGLPYRMTMCNIFFCLDYFRYFAPSSGGPIGNRAYMEEIVRSSGHSPEDFFIFTEKARSGDPLPR